MTRVAIVILFLGLIVALTLTILRRERPASETIPAAQYDLTEKQVESLSVKANAGDCVAAGVLADYYINVATDFNSGLKWARPASTCAGIRPKERFLFLLVQSKPNPQITNEIDVLLNEIRKISPAEAERIEVGLPAVKRRLEKTDVQVAPKK